MKPKKRNRDQRQAIAVYREQKSKEPLFDTGPVPVGGSSRTNAAPRISATSNSGRRPNALNRISGLFTAGLLLLSATNN